MKFTEEQTLVRVKCWCGIKHAVPEPLRNEQLRQFNDGHHSVMSIYCPLGHTHIPSGTPECEKVQRRLDQERERHNLTRSRLDQTEARRRAEKGAKTKLKKRIAAGVCPCCQRSFQNLARHVKSKHPDYPETEAKPSTN